MKYDHDAIVRAYPNYGSIVDDSGVFDQNGDPLEIDQAKVDAARAELDALAYKNQRAAEYPDIGTQLDYIYHHGIDAWRTDVIDPVKAKYPKP